MVVYANAVNFDVQDLEISDQQNFSKVHGEADFPAVQECYIVASTNLIVTGRLFPLSPY